MRHLVAGYRDGRSCIVEEVDCSPSADGMSTQSVASLDLRNLPPRPPGKDEFVDIPAPEGTMRWMRVRFEPNETRRVHHTDTIDCHTVVAGRIEALLDDGVHMLEVGDSLMMMGVDHGWRMGPEGCVVSMILLGTPKP